MSRKVTLFLCYAQMQVPCILKSYTNTTYHYVNVSKHEHRSKLLHNWCKQISQSRTFRSCMKVMCSCKNEIHLANYQKYKLCKV
jgi:hypothetical protein